MADAHLDAEMTDAEQQAAAEAIVQAGAVPGEDPDAALEVWDAYTNLDPTAKNNEALQWLLEKVIDGPSGSANSNGGNFADVKSLIHRPSLFTGELPEKEDVRA